MSKWRLEGLDAAHGPSRRVPSTALQALRTGFDFAQPLLRMDGSGNIAPMIRGFLTRRAEWPARIADPDALPPLTLLWREVGSLARAIGGRIRPLPP